MGTIVNVHLLFLNSQIVERDKVFGKRNGRGGHPLNDALPKRSGTMQAPESDTAHHQGSFSVRNERQDAGRCREEFHVFANELLVLCQIQGVLGQHGHGTRSFVPTVGNAWCRYA